MEGQPFRMQGVCGSEEAGACGCERYTFFITTWCSGASTKKVTLSEGSDFSEVNKPNLCKHILGTSIPWKEECMNHDRGERTDHLPIFDPTKLCQKNRIQIDRYKSLLHQSTLIEETVT